MNLTERLLTIDSTVKARLIEAIEIHGHLGPFLVLGMRMGLLAEKLFGGRVRFYEVYLPDKKPYLCACDGIRAIVGENPVITQKSDGISATFHDSKNRKIVLAIKGRIIEKYAKEPFSRCEENAFEVLSKEDEEILDQVV